MKSELQNKLIEKYPKFFDYLKNYDGPIIPIQFGFEVGNGWYWLLDELMGTIYDYCENNNKDVPCIHQIKEKYGSLCFYVGGANETIYGMIWLAESMSNHICETCGSTENVGQTEGWIYTICAKCLETNERAKQLKWNRI